MWSAVNMYWLREAAKNIFFIVARPLGGGLVRAWFLRKNTFFFSFDGGGRRGRGLNRPSFFFIYFFNKKLSP